MPSSSGQYGWINWPVLKNSAQMRASPAFVSPRTLRLANAGVIFVFCLIRFVHRLQFGLCEVTQTHVCVCATVLSFSNCKVCTRDETDRPAGRQVVEKYRLVCKNCTKIWLPCLHSSAYYTYFQRRLTVKLRTTDSGLHCGYIL